MVTEYEFNLPVGFVDQNGQHQQFGRMRLATAADEMDAIEMLEGQHPSRLPLYLLDRVITQLGSYGAESIDPRFLQQLYAADLAFLSDVYLQINSPSQNGGVQA